jgi:hypothetical protein
LEKRIISKYLLDGAGTTRYNKGVMTLLHRGSPVLHKGPTTVVCNHQDWAEVNESLPSITIFTLDRLEREYIVRMLVENLRLAKGHLLYIVRGGELKTFERVQAANKVYKEFYRFLTDPSKVHDSTIKDMVSLKNISRILDKPLHLTESYVRLTEATIGVMSDQDIWEYFEK